LAHTIKTTAVEPLNAGTVFLDAICGFVDESISSRRLRAFLAQILADVPIQFDKLGVHASQCVLPRLLNHVNYSIGIQGNFAAHILT
jgi:hypothetical protein